MRTIPPGAPRAVSSASCFFHSDGAWKAFGLVTRPCQPTVVQGIQSQQCRITLADYRDERFHLSLEIKRKRSAPRVVGLCSTAAKRRWFVLVRWSTSSTSRKCDGNPSRVLRNANMGTSHLYGVSCTFVTSPSSSHEVQWLSKHLPNPCGAASFVGG